MPQERVDGESSKHDAGRVVVDTDAVFSAPIAAARVRGVDVVAGLVAAEGLVRVVAFSQGRSTWTADVLKDAKWSADVELRVLPAAGGVAVVWSGRRGARAASRTLVQLGPGGELARPPHEVGDVFCATADGIAWLGARAMGSIPVRARRWSEGDARDVLAIPAERDASLVCGEHRVFAVAEGTEDITASAFVPGDASAGTPRTVLRAGEFGDEEREHDTFSVDDELGLVRVGVSGSMAIRFAGPSGESKWQRLRNRLSEEDEVVAADAADGAVVLVMTHETDAACPGSAATPDGVWGIRMGRRTGDESRVELAPVDCARGASGPFWVAASRPAPTVAWVVRRAAPSPKAPPVEALAYRVLPGAGAPSSGDIPSPADALVDGGCDETSCMAAFLVRPAGGDGMQPAPIRVVHYP